MGKCKACGRPIDDKFELCYTCNAAPQANASAAKNASIERQVAAKCVAQMFEGTGYKYSTDGISENDIVSCFNLFLKLIRGS